MRGREGRHEDGMADRRSLRWRCEGLATSATEDGAALETVAVQRGEQGARGRWLTGVEGTESLVRGRARAGADGEREAGW